MKKFFKRQLAILSAIVALVTIPVAVPVFAAGSNPAAEKAICEGSGGVWANNACGKTGAKSFTENLASITNLLLFIIGAISVIMIIIGGIRYVTSSGDQTAVTAAKNTILYAIIGVVVSFLA